MQGVSLSDYCVPGMKPNGCLSHCGRL